MKRYFITAVLALTVSFSYAQKVELAAAKKALDSKDYQSALTNAQKAQDVIKQNPSATSAQKAQAMYIAGAAALELAGDNVDAVSAAVKQLSEVVEFEKGKDYSARNISTKKVESFDTQEALDEAMISGNYDKQKIVDRARTYSPEVTAKLTQLSNDLYKKAIDKYNAQQYVDAAKYFDATYDAQSQCSPRPDTSVYSNSATCMILVKDYAKAGEYYKKLLDLDYTGIETIYYAVNAINGKKQSYASKKDRDAEVKLKVATDPTEETLPNKQPEIYTTLLQILYQTAKEKEPFDFAEFLVYADKAIAKYPENKEFLLMKGQAYYEMKDIDTFLSILKDAAAKFTDDATIQYNMGYILSEKKDIEGAKEAYKKATELDPKYADAYINWAGLYRDQNGAIADEINKLPFTLNKEQKALYDKLNAQIKENNMKMIEIMELGFKANPDNHFMAKNLENLYNTVGDKENEKKYADIYAKLTGM